MNATSFAERHVADEAGPSSIPFDGDLPGDPLCDCAARRDEIYKQASSDDAVFGLMVLVEKVKGDLDGCINAIEFPEPPVAATSLSTHRGKSEGVPA